MVTIIPGTRFFRAYEDAQRVLPTGQDESQRAPLADWLGEALTAGGHDELYFSDYLPAGDLSADDSVKINQAINDAVATGKILKFQSGQQYRCDSPINFVSGMMVSAYGAEFYRNCQTAGGGGGLFTQLDVDSRLQRCHWRGGYVDGWTDVGFGPGMTSANLPRFPVPEGTASPSVPGYGGYTGNIFGLFGDDIDIADVYVVNWGNNSWEDLGGRIFGFSGDRFKLDNITGIASDTRVGVGGFRFTGGRDCRFTRLHIVCGDDCFQYVPISIGFTLGPGGEVIPNDEATGKQDLQIHNCWYINCTGRSNNAKLMVAGIEPNLLSQHGGFEHGISYSGWAFVRGYAEGCGIKIANTASPPGLHHLAAINCHVDNGAGTVDRATILVTAHTGIDIRTGLEDNFPVHDIVFDNFFIENSLERVISVEGVLKPHHVFFNRVLATAPRLPGEPTVYLSTDDSVVRDCDFTSNGADAILADNCHGLIIDGGRARIDGGEGLTCLRVGNSVNPVGRNIRVQNWQATAASGINSGTGIFVEGAGGSVLRDSSFVNNSLDNPSAAAFVPFYFADLSDNGTNLIDSNSGSQIRRHPSCSYGGKSFDPGSLAAGASESVTVDTPGALVGDGIAMLSFSTLLQGIVLSAEVTAANVVTVTFRNVTAGTLNLGVGLLRVRTERYDDVVILGPELLTNGTFASDTDWTKDPCWTIASGEAVKTPGTDGGIWQNVAGLVAGRYRITTDVSERTAFGVTPRAIGGTVVAGATVTSATISVQEIDLDGTNTGFELKSGAATADLRVASVSLKQRF